MMNKNTISAPAQVQQQQQKSDEEQLPSEPSEKADRPVRDALPSTQTQYRRTLIALLVISQMCWAMVVPIKNVLVMSTPKVRDDQEETSTTTYPGVQTGVEHQLSGSQVLTLVQNVLDLSITNAAIRRTFEERGDFVIDDLVSMLTPEQHQTFGLYYGLVMQSSEVLAASFTPREEQIIIQNTSTKANVKLTLKCPTANAQLQGMLCTDGVTGLPCDDNSFDDFVPKPTTKLQPVQLSDIVGSKAGWHNNAALMSFIEFFHQIMRQLFAKQSWEAALLPYQDYSVIYNPYPLPLTFTGDNDLLTMPDEATFWVNDGAYLQYGRNTFVSCALSEIVLGYVYVRRFTIDLIQQKLQSLALYKVNESLVDSPAGVLDRARIVFNSTVNVTVGAGYYDFAADKRMLHTVVMTQKASSSALIKRNRPMQGSMLMGSSIRHLWYMMRYPNSYYSYMTPEVRSDSVVLEYRQIGSLHSGFNGMKFDFTRNVMAVVKLSERAKSEGTGADFDWFAQEQRYADWFFERESVDLVPLVQHHFGDLDVGTTREVECFRGLIRKIAQVAWVMALRNHNTLNHLVYTAMIDGGDPASWTAKQMLVDELVVEDPYGYRSSIPYVRTSISPNTGNAWPMVPLLTAFAKVFGPTKTLSLLESEMNTTYNDLIELEGANTQFRDVVFCPIGVGALGVDKNDNKPSMYNKIFPALHDLLKDVIAAMPKMHVAMEKEISPVQVRQEFLLWNRHHPIFQFEGSPVFWKNSALAVGLVRLATKEAPLPEDLEKFKDTVVCYNTLELRYLNVSTRCWNELLSVEETRTKRSSEGLRVISFSMWSMGVVLNVIGAYVAINYSRRLWTCWVRSGYEDISMELAINLDIQSIGMLRLGQCAIMSFSVVPMIMSYHLPTDKEFTFSTTTVYPTWLVEIIVALGMTWFVRLGMEVGRYFLHLKHFNRWFYISSTRVRYTAVIVTAIVRLAMPLHQGDFNMGIWKLVVSCLVSMLLGFSMILMSKRFEKPNFQPRDRLSQLLMKGGFDRNWYGVLGQTTKGWSYVGLLFEGWLVVQRSSGRVGLVHTKLLDLEDPSQTKTMPLDTGTFQCIVRRDHRSQARSHVSTHGITKKVAVKPRQEALLNSNKSGRWPSKNAVFPHAASFTFKKE